ncbi:MAG: multiheme c-type cytochrome [Nannocystaceae bacterium]
MPSAWRSQPALRGLLLAVAALSGCVGGPVDGGEAPHPATADERPAAPTQRDAAIDLDRLAARLPDPGDALAPALTRVAPEVDGRELADVASCERCHADAVAHWRTSAHAWASFNNPIYRASIDRFQETLGRERSRFCAGCHDPALLVDGAMDEPVAADDPRAHAGVTCMACHGIDEARSDGNGSYHLARSAPLIPDVDDPTSVAAHRRQVASPILRSGELCGSCHRAFLDDASGHPAFFAGTDDLGPWQASAYAGHPRRLDAAVDERGCVDCHMAKEAATRGDRAATAGQIASHRFPGGHTWLAAIRGDEATERAVAERLTGVASVDVGALRHGERYVMPADAAPVVAGERVEAEVVLRNLAVGHRFPGGTRDSHDTRVEVDLRAADGRLLARTTDPHRLRSGVLGDDGHPRLAREVEALRVGAFDHTIAPRDAVVVRFAVDVPADLDADAWPLRLEARLVHRSRSEELVEATCAAAATAPGRAFLRRSRESRGDPLDACAAPPATLIAAAAVELGAGASPRSERPAWIRLYELGLGLEHEVQERLDRARQAYEAALAEVGDDPEATAMILGGLASVAARQGRVDDALALTREIAAVAPELAASPALDVLRGRALAAVWRWSTAVAPLEAVAAAFAEDPLAWRELGLARGSAGDRLGALEAARAGLVLTPRDPDLLRVQALALRELEHPGADEAMDAYLRHRSADFGPGLRARCSRESPTCARERLPVHTHELEPVDPAAPTR